MMTIEEINKRKETIEKISDPVVRVKELNKLCDEVELENLELRIAKREREFNAALKEGLGYNRNQTVSQPQSSSLAFLPLVLVFGSILLLAVCVLSSL